MWRNGLARVVRGRTCGRLRGIAWLSVLALLPLFAASAGEPAHGNGSTADACVAREYVPSREELQAALGRLVGLWEAEDPGNRWRMEVRAEPGSGSVRGILVRNGKRSREVGFTVGEHVFTARVAPERAAIVIDQKWRWGRDGRSVSMQWLSGELDLCRSSIDRLVTRAGYVYRRIR